MRIVGGRYRGRRLQVPEGQDVRPTSDRSREALFNILEAGRLTDGKNPVVDARVLDAFAGSGALGLEALSRGASDILFIEQAPRALSCLRQNVDGISAPGSLHVLKASVLKPPSTDSPCDIVFMDPPYDQDLAVPALMALRDAGWLGGESLAIVETSRKELQEVPEDFELLDRRVYGRAQISFLRLARVL